MIYLLSFFEFNLSSKITEFEKESEHENISKAESWDLTVLAATRYKKLRQFANQRSRRRETPRIPRRQMRLSRPRQKVLTQEGSDLNRFPTSSIPSTIGGSGDYLRIYRIFSSLWLSVAILVASTARYSRNEGLLGSWVFSQTKKTAPESKGSDSFEKISRILSYGAFPKIGESCQIPK